MCCHKTLKAQPWLWHGLIFLFLDSVLTRWAGGRDAQTCDPWNFLGTFWRPGRWVHWQVNGGKEGAASSAPLSHVRHVITLVGPTTCDDVAL